jgi:hypothetical protein
LRMTLSYGSNARLLSGEPAFRHYGASRALRVFAMLNPNS